ncbi:MAG: O-antigen ligase family protein [Elusimicrobia bacterium]|nr:O-antigen ligase family protein [Elusimicrobiota bacterium]
MLAALVGVQVAAGLLLRGAWDLWAQSAVLILLTCALGLWLAARVALGRVPLPSPRPLGWAAALALLSLLSARLGPTPAYGLPAWAAAAAGLALIPLVTLLSSEDRVRVEQGVRAAAWVLALLAVYQHFHGEPRPPSSLINENVFAGAILLLLPFAARRGDPLLAAVLLLCLWWTRSVGAWLGLSAALVLNRRTVGAAAFWAGAAAGFAALVAAYAKLQSPEVLHRLAWWGAAWRMSWSAPWLGLGPGSFAYALPAFVGARPELSSLYAHQHFLETAAERGWPYLLLWVAGLAALLRRAEPAKRFGPLAALIHGLVDYPLSVPGVFWLFCLSAAWALPESEEAVAVRGRRKLPAAALALALAAAGAWWAAGNWRADRLRAAAVETISEGGGPARAEALLEASEAVRPHPETARLLAELELMRASGPDAPERLSAAAADLERSVSLDPYRASNWTMLENIYRKLGRPEDAARARARGALTCPSLRSPA